MRRRAILAFALAAAIPPARARAHAMPSSSVSVEILPASVRLAVLIPWSEMDAALGSLSGGAAEVETKVRGYLLEHAVIRGADGRSWIGEFAGISSGHAGGLPTSGHGHPFLVAILNFTPAVGASAKATTLRYDAVNHRVASHYALVYRKVGEVLTPLGRLQSPATELKLPPTP